MLCIRRHAGTTSIGRLSNVPTQLTETQRDRARQEGPNNPPPNTVPVNPPSQVITPANPTKWGLPPRIKNLDITSQAIDFENRTLSFTIKYVPVAADNVDDENECPPVVDNPVLLIGHQFPFTDPPELSKTLSISCEDDPESFAHFLNGGQSSFVPNTVPQGYTGKFAEDFFFSYFIGDSPFAVDNIDLFECVREIPICRQNPTGQDFTTPGNRGLTLRAVAIDGERVKYRLNVNGKPATVIARRQDDNVGLDLTSPQFNFDALPPELEESLVKLVETVDEKIEPAAKEEMKQRHDPEDEDATDDEKPVCGFSKDVEYQDILNLLAFNHSFFSEPILDLLFARIWAILELILFMCWNIFPLCDAEWKEVKQYVKNVFSIDPIKGDGACFPPILEKIYDTMVETIFIPSTCCNAKELFASLVQFIANPAIGLLKILRLLQACVFFWLVCLLRIIRNFIALILLYMAKFILFAITYGAKCICSMMSGDSTKIQTNCVQSLAEEIAAVDKALEGGESIIG